MLVKREYHTAEGHIGSVTFEAPDGVYKLDGFELPIEGVEHLLTFALQSLQDAYAASDITLEERIKRFNKKRERILEGTIGTGGGRGPAVDEVTEEAFSILRDGNKKIDRTCKAFKGKGAAQRERKYLLGKLEENPDVRELAQKRVDERHKTLAGLNIKA